MYSIALIVCLCVFPDVIHPHPLEDVSNSPISSASIQPLNNISTTPDDLSHIQSLLPGAQQINSQELEAALNNTNQNRDRTARNVDVESKIPTISYFKNITSEDGGNNTSLENGFEQIEIAVFEYATDGNSTNPRDRRKSDGDDSESDESNSSEEQAHNVTKRESRLFLEKLDDLRPSATQFAVNGNSKLYPQRNVRDVDHKISPGGRVKGHPVKAPVRRGPISENAKGSGRKVRDTDELKASSQENLSTAALQDKVSLKHVEQKDLQGNTTRKDLIRTERNLHSTSEDKSSESTVQDQSTTKVPLPRVAYF